MQKNIIVAAGGLVFNERKELLMIFRRGFWDLPKGKSDKDESAETCAIREVQEETGLKKIDLKKLIGITYHDYFDEWTKQNVTKETHWFEMHSLSTEKLIPQTEEDIQEIKWCDVQTTKTHLQNSYKNIVEIIDKFGFLSN